LTEQTDAVVVVVSEETGSISFAHEGELERNLEAAEFVPRLQALLAGEPDGETSPAAPSPKS
jgi:diadenylate cyclase